MSRRRVIAVLLAPLLAAPLLAGCGAGRDAQTINIRGITDAAAIDVGSLQVRNVYVGPPETGVYGEGGNAPLYLAVANRTNSPDMLTSVTSDTASLVVVAKADPAGGAAIATGGTGLPLEVPAGTALHFQPGSTHLVLQGLTRRLLPGQSVQVTFTFARAGSTTLTVPVGLAEDAASLP